MPEIANSEPAKIISLAAMRVKLRPPEPGSLAAILRNIDAVRTTAQQRAETNG